MPSFILGKKNKRTILSELKQDYTLKRNSKFERIIELNVIDCRQFIFTVDIIDIASGPVCFQRIYE